MGRLAVGRFGQLRCQSVVELLPILGEALGALATRELGEFLCL
jgi:hypothetical protein